MKFHLDPSEWLTKKNLIIENKRKKEKTERDQWKKIMIEEVYIQVEEQIKAGKKYIFIDSNNVSIPSGVFNALATEIKKEIREALVIAGFLVRFTGPESNASLYIIGVNHENTK